MIEYTSEYLVIIVEYADARGKPSTVFPRGGHVETERTQYVRRSRQQPEYNDTNSDQSIWKPDCNAEMNEWRTTAIKHTVAFMVGIVAPRNSKCPLLFEKQIVHANPATRLPSEVQAASARSNYNSITKYLDENHKKLLHEINHKMRHEKSDHMMNATQNRPKPDSKSDLYQQMQHT